ncbi:MAG: diguanylate cyclase [Candidatus Omnitrophota bacterium]
MFRLDKNLIKVTTGAIILSLLYCLLINQLPFLNTLSLKTQDLFSNLRYKIKPKPKELKNICIIAIDEESFRQLNKKWPWPRSIYAEFINKLTQYQPKTISLDLQFFGKSQDANDDMLLGQSIRNAGNVVLSAYIAAHGRYDRPLDDLEEAAFESGFVNKPRDSDLIIRTSRLLYPKEVGSKSLDSSFGFKSALGFWGLKGKYVKITKNSLLIIPKHLSVPFNRHGTLKLNFQAKTDDFQIIPFYKIINQAAKKEEISGKLVAVGTTAEIFHDIHQTPFGLMPGVMINANEILMYLSGEFIKDIPLPLQSAFIFIVAVFSAIITYKLKALKGFLILLAQLIGIFCLSLILSLRNFSADYFGPIFITSLAYLGVETYKYVRLIIEAAVLKTMAITDGLTGLYVHRYLMLKLESEFNRAKEENTQLSFLIMDIDHFKNINDTYGHEQGNIILKDIAKIIKDNSRKVDIVARYGGEEFCTILPGTPEKGANIFAERLRKMIEEFAFPYQEGKSLKVTISIGISSLKQTNALTPQELIAFADKALYQAKETGRNKVCMFIPPENPAQK